MHTLKALLRPASGLKYSPCLTNPTRHRPWPGLKPALPVRPSFQCRNFHPSRPKLMGITSLGEEIMAPSHFLLTSIHAGLPWGLTIATAAVVVNLLLLHTNDHVAQKVRKQLEDVLPVGQAREMYMGRKFRFHRLAANDGVEKKKQKGQEELLEQAAGDTRKDHIRLFGRFGPTPEQASEKIVSFSMLRFGITWSMAEAIRSISGSTESILQLTCQAIPVSLVLFKPNHNLPTDSPVESILHHHWYDPSIVSIEHSTLAPYLPVFIGILMLVHYGIIIRARPSRESGLLAVLGDTDRAVVATMSVLLGLFPLFANLPTSVYWFWFCSQLTCIGHHIWRRRALSRVPLRQLQTRSKCSRPPVIPFYVNPKK